jgi:hypothetical protein
MTDDIVDRLYDCSIFGAKGAERLCSEAASEITWLREVIRRTLDWYDKQDGQHKPLPLNIETNLRSVLEPKI